MKTCMELQTSTAVEVTLIFTRNSPLNLTFYFKFVAHAVKSFSALCFIISQHVLWHQQSAE